MRDAKMLLTVQNHPHFGLEVGVSELPEGERLSGCILQHTESDADGVLRREACRMDKPGGADRKVGRRVYTCSVLFHLKRVWTKDRDTT